MKKHLLVLASLVTLNTFGQGFSNSSINWSAPNGGKLSGGTSFGFHSNFGTAFSTDNNNSQSWGLLDMNGDRKPDLVVFAQLQSGLVTCFQPGLNPYWNVYLNTGAGFSTTPMQWSIPSGGKSANNNFYGFVGLSGVASASDVNGSQSWSVMDMDGDNKPDLVVTAALSNGKVYGLSQAGSQYWMVYKNNGTSFTGPAITWALPDGGKRVGSTPDVYGFDMTSGTAGFGDATGSQSWELTDMNADGKPDLIITAQVQAGNATVFSPGNNPYWKVYTNTGSGFSTSASNWNLPNGGKLPSSSVNLGYNALSGTALVTEYTGSQTWGLADVDGDRQPDLIVAGQLQGGQVTCFSAGTSPYWKVYANTGNGFNTNGTNWSVPLGGKTISSTVTYGFNNLSGVGFSSEYAGTQSWRLFDFDNDNRVDLAVTAQLQGGNVTSFSPGSGQYWKVYPNRGSGFLNTPVNYSLPNGGKLSNAVVYGFDDIAGTAFTGQNNNSQSWTLGDLDGDRLTDLVITAQLDNGNVTSFSPGSGQYWKLYKGDGLLGIPSLTGKAGLNNILFYPNPNNGEFTISGEENEVLTVSNELGQAIMQIALTPENNYTGQISGLKTGIYFLSTKTGCAKVAVTN